MKEQLKKADVYGLVLIASALISYFIRSVWTYWQTGAVVLGGVLLVVSLVLKSAEIREGMGRRSTRFGINSATSVVLLIGVLAFVNYLGAQHQKRIDMTTEHLHSLSDQSVQVAGQVQGDLKIKAFYPGGDDPATKDLLELYSAQNNRIAVEFIDPDKQPQTAQEYQVTSYGSSPMGGGAFGTVILEMDGKNERIEKQSGVLEEDVTNALTKLVKGEKKTVYFVEGHGERPIASTDRTGYKAASNELEKANYGIKAVNLVQEGKVPDDASVVVMAGPQNEPFPQETDMLDAYLASGGAVLLLLDPSPSASLKDFARKWSIDVGDNRVLDASGVGKLFGAGPEIPLGQIYARHKITEKFNVMTFFPLARSVSPLKPPVDGITVEPLVETSERSWGEADMKSAEVSFDEKTDLAGPVPVAIVATKDAVEGKKGRLIVFGDSDFAMNSFFGTQGNGNLFTNAVKWLAQDENFISIAAKNPADRPIQMTESDGRLVSTVVVFLFPGAILAAGVFVWVKRRQ